jgi:hypothetical protein
MHKSAQKKCNNVNGKTGTVQSEKDSAVIPSALKQGATPISD